MKISLTVTILLISNFVFCQKEWYSIFKQCNGEKSCVEIGMYFDSETPRLATSSDIILVSTKNPDDCPDRTYVLKPKEDLTWIYKDSELKIEVEMKYVETNFGLDISMFSVRSFGRCCMISNFRKKF